MEKKNEDARIKTNKKIEDLRIRMEKKNEDLRIRMEKKNVDLRDEFRKERGELKKKMDNMQKEINGLIKKNLEKDEKIMKLQNTINGMYGELFGIKAQRGKINESIWKNEKLDVKWENSSLKKEIEKLQRKISEPSLKKWNFKKNKKIIVVNFLV